MDSNQIIAPLFGLRTTRQAQRTEAFEEPIPQSSHNRAAESFAPVIV